MQERGFDGIRDAEGTWFYDARMYAITRVLAHFRAHDEDICEVGAGYGAMCATLKRFGRVSAFEPDIEARKKCVENCDAVLEGQSLEEVLVSKTGAFSLVSILDVIEHVEDDAKFARELHALLKPGGHILVTVPAFQWLWSELDVVAMHYRRYDKKQIVTVLEKAGFEIEYVSYWNMMLLLPAAAVRVGTGKAGYAAFGMPRWLDRIFYTWVRLETMLMTHVPLPFGTSVFVYARRK